MVAPPCAMPHLLLILHQFLLVQLVISRIQRGDRKPAGLPAVHFDEEWPRGPKKSFANGPTNLIIFNIGQLA